MAANKGFQNIKQLVEQLSKDIDELDRGMVDIGRLEEMCDSAKELYERLIVLRHKGREAVSNGESQVEVQKDVPQEASIPEIKLDLSEPMATSGQTSLIDAIEESDDDGGASIAEKVGASPITDLPSAIGINQKFMFISRLFGGDNQRYQKTLEELGTMNEKGQAMELVRSLAIEEGEESQVALEQFTELIERKFA